MQTTENGQGLVDSKLLHSKRFRIHQFFVFSLTAAMYATFHASRTAWAYSHKAVENDDYFTYEHLSILDTIFMLSYAVGMFYNGWVGDQSNLKSFLAKGAFISIFGFCLFGLFARLDLNNTIAYSFLFVLNGFGQSRGFPGSMAVLGNWIETEHRGLLIGLWNSCVNIGNIMGQQIARLAIDEIHLDWSYVLFIVGGCMLFMIVIMLLFLKTHPKEAGLQLARKENEKPKDIQIVQLKNGPPEENIEIKPAQDLSVSEIPKGISFLEAWKTPGIIKYGLIYACIKGSTYGLLFWLPDYLQTEIGFGGESANITATYEFGQFFGAICLGYYSDKLHKRSFVVVISLYFSSFIFIYLTSLKSGTSALMFGLILFLAGFFFGGPEVIVGSIVSSDIGESISLKNHSRALSTIVGIIDGTGSIGASLVQLIIPLLKSHSFFLYFGLCMTAAVLTTPIAIKELRFSKKKEDDKNKAAIEIKPPQEFEMNSRNIEPSKV